MRSRNAERVRRSRTMSGGYDLPGPTRKSSGQHTPEPITHSAHSIASTSPWVTLLDSAGRLDLTI